jgi:hypothetical protein
MVTRFSALESFTFDSSQRLNCHSNFLPIIRMHAVEAGMQQRWVQALNKGGRNGSL